MNAPKWTGCPCGHGIYDEDCGRHKPIPRPRQPQEHDAQTLGGGHNPYTCPQCRAIARAS